MRLLKVLVFFDEISLGCGDVCFLPFCLIFLSAFLGDIGLVCSVCLVLLSMYLGS